MKKAPQRDKMFILIMKCTVQTLGSALMLLAECWSCDASVTTCISLQSFLSYFKAEQPPSLCYIVDVTIQILSDSLFHSCGAVRNFDFCFSRLGVTHTHVKHCSGHNPEEKKSCTYYMGFSLKTLPKIKTNKVTVTAHISNPVTESSATQTLKTACCHHQLLHLF